MKLKGSVFAVMLLAVLLLFGTPVFVFGEDTATSTSTTSRGEIEALNHRIKEKQDKIKQLEQSIETYKKKIAEKRLEAVSLSNQIAILDNRLAQIELDIEVTENKLDALNF